MQSFPIPGIERHLPLFRKRMFLINNGPQPTMEAARLACSNRKLRSGSKSENARRNDAIYDRERRTTRRRKKRKNQQRIWNAQRRVDMFRCICRHALSRPYTYVFANILVWVLACAHTCEVTCRPVVWRCISSIEGCFSVWGRGRRA